MSSIDPHPPAQNVVKAGHILHRESCQDNNVPSLGSLGLLHLLIFYVSQCDFPSSGSPVHHLNVCIFIPYAVENSLPQLEHGCWKLISFILAGSGCYSFPSCGYGFCFSAILFPLVWIVGWGTAALLWHIWLCSPTSQSHLYKTSHQGTLTHHDSIALSSSEVTGPHPTGYVIKHTTCDRRSHCSTPQWMGASTDCSVFFRP